MQDKVDYLPVGSVIVLNGGNSKYVIISRAMQTIVGGKKMFFDYVGCRYPQGLIDESAMYFQHKDIKEIVFRGYSDQEDKEIVEKIQKAFVDMGLVHADVGMAKSLIKNKK